MLTLNILGDDSLAEATRRCCQKHFILSAHNADVVWMCWDTPIGKDDVPDSEWVIQQIGSHLPPLGSPALVLVSSQLPVGTTARLERDYPGYTFAYNPENIRVASATSDFNEQARVVVGRRTERHDFILGQLFSPFTKQLILTDPETAEMVKHSVNCWLGMNIAFINEIARLAEVVGADANVISQALLLERRVGGKAPLRPGSPFGGGHLARDIHNLSYLAKTAGIHAPIISNIKHSNTPVEALAFTTDHA